MGFVTTRVAQGNGPTEVATTIERCLNEELRSFLLNKPADPPEITMGEVYEIDEDAARGIPVTGCTWYPDDCLSPNLDVHYAVASLILVGMRASNGIQRTSV